MAVFFLHVCLAAGHAQRGLELDAGMWQCHQWYAIALGSQIKHEGTQRKITGGHEYKVHKMMTRPHPQALLQG